MNIEKLLIVGSSGKGALEKSYLNAAHDLKLQVNLFDPDLIQSRYIKGSKIGKIVHTFLPLEQWIRKMNRDLVIEVKKWKPDLIMIFTSAKILPGTLATIKTIAPSLPIVWIWPDTPLNLSQHNLSNFPLIDLLATYSSASMPVFEKFGMKNIIWCPLAGDPTMHGKESVATDFDADISFVGMWRPEREAALSVICQAFPTKRIVIYGGNWDRDCKDPAVKSKVAGKGLYEKELSTFFNKSRININVIDDTNYPAANMRFFEVPIAGGLQLSSSCPEMEEQLIDRQDIVYFHTQDQLVTALNWIFDNEEKAHEIRTSGNRVVHQQHTYIHRLRQILDNLQHR